MGTQGVNGAGDLSRAQLVAKLNEAVQKGDYQAVAKYNNAILAFDEKASEAGTRVEESKDQPLTEEQKTEKNEARQKELEEIATMKEKSKMASDAGRFATDTDVLREKQQQYDTKEEAQEHFELGNKFRDKRAAKKIAKAASQNIESMDSYDALEKIYTNKDEYKKAVEQAKADGTWDKDNPKFRLLDGKALEGAKHLQETAAKKVDDALKSYQLNAKIYENPESEEDKQAAFEIMKKAANEINQYYTASKMFDENGNIDTEAYQKAMLQYSGSDFKGNLDERKVLAEDADVKKRHTDNMLEAAGLDAEKDYTWAMRAGVVALGLGSGALAGLLGGGATATAVATAVANATATATATATANVNWTGMAGDEFNTSVTSSTTATSSVTDRATDTATATISKGRSILTGMAGSLLPSILAAIAVKDNGGKDAFNGAAVMDVLENPDQVKGRANKAIMNQLADMEITGDPIRDKEIKAAILTTAMSDKTGKKVNTRELSAAYAVAEYLKDNPELVNPKPTSTTSTSSTDTTGTTSTPTVTTPTVSTPIRDIERTEDVAKDFTVKHRSGLGPYQYAEALGVPEKYRMEFVRQFQEDNNMNRQGTKWNPNPVIQKEYTFKDGTKFNVDPDTAQKKINDYSIKGDNTWRGGKQTTSTGRAIAMQNGHWVYVDTKERVPNAELGKHPTYIDYCEKHPDEPGKQGVQPQPEAE